MIIGIIIIIIGQNEKVSMAKKKKKLIMTWKTLALSLSRKFP